MHIKGYTKFNIGDLVCLSAYGNAREYNTSYYGHWGIVIENENPYNCNFPYKVEFLSKGKTNRFSVFHPRELKHFKPNKEVDYDLSNRRHCIDEI